MFSCRKSHIEPFHRQDMALLVLCVPIQIVFEESVMDNLSVGFYRRIAAKIWARAIPINQPQIDLNRQTEIMFILVFCICITSLLLTAELCRYIRFNRYLLFKPSQSTYHNFYSVSIYISQNKILHKSKLAYQTISSCYTYFIRKHSD